MPKIALIIGSLSRQSLNRHIAKHIVKAFPADFQVEEVQINDLPLYTQDLDSESVPAYDRVRAQLAQADGVLIVSPEHNRTIPAALKNVLDIASRPYGQGVWQGKKTAIITASPSAYGGINAGLHIRLCVEMMGANVMLNPEVFLSKANTALDEQGNVSDARTADFLNKFAQSFAQWLK